MIESILNGSWADRGINFCLPIVLPKINGYLAEGKKIDNDIAKVWGRVMANAIVLSLAGALVLSAVFSFKAVIIVSMFNLTVLAVAALTKQAAVSPVGHRLGGAPLPVG